MRWTLVAGLVAMLSVVSARSARAAEFSEFRIPRHVWSFARADLDAALRHDRSNGVPQMISSSQKFLRSTLQTAWALDSDDTYRYASLRGTFDGVSNDTESDGGFPPLVSESREDRDKNVSEVLTANGELRTYPWRFPLGFDIKGTATAAFRQGWSSRDVRQELADTTALIQLAGTNGNSWLNNYGILYTATVGWGRVRDATGVYRAFLLERRLQRSGVLSRALSHAARERIAALYYAEPDYRIPHDRPDKFFWREIENILVEDGALEPGGLDAYSVLQALESYAIQRATLRRAGFFAGPTITGRYIYNVIRSHSENTSALFVGDSLASSGRVSASSRFSSSSDDVLFGAFAEYHRPFGVRTQLDMQSAIRIPTRETTRALEFSSQATLGYLVADRWEATASFSHQRNIDPTAAIPNSRWAVFSSFELAYYLEDRVRIALRGTHQQQREDLENIGEFYRRLEEISLAITYHFFRGLSAPGLIEPQNMLPPSEPLY